MYIYLIHFKIHNYGDTLSIETVYRCYDNKRRIWTDQHPSRQEQVLKNRGKTNRRSKQIQVHNTVCIIHVSVVHAPITFLQLYTRRGKYLKGKGKTFWDSINASFMSEESAHESEGELVMYKHTPEYRSDGNRIFWF